MTQRHYQFLLVMVALLFASFACQSLTGEAAMATQEPAVPTKAVSQPTLERVTVESEGAGTLCVGSRTGLSCLNESGWQLYTEENSDLPNNYLYAGAVCPDGQIAIVHTESASAPNLGR